MFIPSQDGVLEFHFHLTPGGWFLGAFASDPFYEPQNTMRYVDLLSAKQQLAGRRHFKPVFHIDFVSRTCVNISWDDLSVDPADGIQTFIHQQLIEMDKEFALRLSTVMEPLLCTENFLNGLQTTRSFLTV